MPIIDVYGAATVDILGHSMGGEVAANGTQADGSFVDAPVPDR
jgi:pimeloyl-ACP methyl ester carboxylesterase